MAEPIRIEFEGSLSKYSNPCLESVIQLTFLKVDNQPTDTELANMHMRRFKVVMTEIKDW
jgi:hypothetical protein